MELNSNEILAKLKASISNFDPKDSAHWAQRALDAGIEPLDAIQELIEAVRQIGADFSEGLLFIPELVAAGSTMQSAMEVLQEEVSKRGQKTTNKGRVVIGTVVGDVHDIGKNMVTTLLRVSGFEVIDLGVNIAGTVFVDAVKKYEPDILALSALMTTTLMEQKRVIESLESEGIRERIKIMVGGAAVTQGFADKIGADGYESTAPGAAELALRLVSR